MMNKIRAWVERAHTSERGYLEVIAPFGLMIIFICLGLVHDGGRLMAAKRDALNTAGAASRAGAMELDELHFRTSGGQVRVHTARAQNAVNEQFAARPNMELVDIQIDGTRVTVVARTSWSPSLLKMMPERTITGEADANLLQGVAG